MAETAQTSSNEASQNGQAQGSILKQYGGTIFRALIMWLAMQYFFGQKRDVQPQHPVGPADTADLDSAAQPSSADSTSGPMVDYFPVLPPGVYHNPYRFQIPQKELPNALYALWPNQAPVDMNIYVNEDEYFVDYNVEPAWRTTGIDLGDVQNREHHVEIPTTKNLQHNGTLYAHIFVTQKGAPIDPSNPRFAPDALVYYRHLLTKYYPKKNVVKQKKLLHRGEEEKEENAEAQEVEEGHQEPEQQLEEQQGGLLAGTMLANFTRRAPLVAYWQENMTVSILNDPKSVIPKSSLQPAILKYIPITTHRDSSGKNGFYRPIVFPNEFWDLKSNAYPINETVSVLPLTIHLEPMSMWKFNMYAAFDDSIKQQSNNPLGGMSATEMDEMKRMLLETNPVLLATTAAVSLLHSAFEFLAFKNDIAFWKKKDNSSGVSVRSLFTNIFFQIVIFLFLMDNNQETSWMILISQGVGLLIEIWKVFKALKYELIWTPGSLFPSVGSRQTEATEIEDETAKYDAIAFKYLSWAAYPLLAGYAVYSLMYDEHKSWYSYVLKTLVEFVYMFGFITMIPQLYINYRLKSVAHMPWKTLMYKSLNTFIDDLFAFVIKMPTLHRLACLRDDIVFFVYLYQRYAYKVDPTRANEFGQIGENAEGEDKTVQKQVEGSEDAETKKNK